MIIGIPVYDGVDLLDMTGPFEMFHWAGFEIDLLAAAPGFRTTGSGFAFSVPRGFAEAQAYDAIWVPGGEPDALARIINDPARTYLDAGSPRANDVLGVRRRHAAGRRRTARWIPGDNALAIPGLFPTLPRSSCGARPSPLRPRP
jgi:putative intracellular protease/amidase